jgi:membrane fusion protein, epimerase transport system
MSAPTLLEDADAQALAAPQAEARRLARAAAWALGLGLAPLLGFLCLAPLASAVVAPGFVKIDLDRRAVQHAEGGVVRDVLVRDGQQVRQGQALLVLGDVPVDADMNRLNYRVAAEHAGVVRLEAEQSLATVLRWPVELSAQAARDPRLSAQFAKEQALFATRRDALGGQTVLLRAQQQKLAQEREALRAQIAQAQESLRLQREELQAQRSLLKDGYISAARIAQLEAVVADYGIKIEERRGDLARAEQRLIDSDLRIRGLQSEYRQQASDQLKVAHTRLAEIMQEQRKATDAAQRQTIAAPAAGTVMNLRFAAPGAVIAPRETIADIVPAQAPLAVEAHIRTDDANRVQLGQRADIHFSAFKHRSLQLVAGKVSYVAPDRNVDAQTGLPYYTVLIEADAKALAQEQDMKLQAGMPAEVFIRGEARTPLQYLLEPITQVMRRAARES